MKFNDWLAENAGVDDSLKGVVTALAETSKALSKRIARGVLGGAIADIAGENADGDAQKALDVIADEMFMQALKTTGVRYYASEEQDTVVEMNAKGGLALAIDPLDGSSNIDVNVSIGTIFSIFPAAGSDEASFMRPGGEQVAAGYTVYGPQTSFVITFGDGVAVFILDPDTGEYTYSGRPEVPPTSKEYAINASNMRHWDKPVRAFINDCNLGEEGPQGKNMNMRWVASLVAETHRILMRGGVFLYPGDKRPGYSKGRLRQIYECAPIAMIIEQAGGLATNTTDRLLDQVPTELHGRTPLVFGSRELVQRVSTYHDLPEREISPLFGERGLFNN